MTETPRSAAAPAPQSASVSAQEYDTQYITGLGTLDHRMLILVDIEKLMTAANRALLEPSVH